MPSEGNYNMSIYGMELKYMFIMWREYKEMISNDYEILLLYYTYEMR